MINVTLTILGIILFGYSIYAQVRFLHLVKGTSLGKWWVVLLTLIVFFSLGYAFYAYWLATDSELINEKIFKNLVTAVFFLGSVFVGIAVSLIYRTVKKINILQAEKVEALLEEEVRLEDEVRKKTIELEREKGSLEIKALKRTAELQKLKDSLENSVKERTAELAKKVEELSYSNKMLEQSKAIMLSLAEDAQAAEKQAREEKSKFGAERDRSEGILGYLHAIREGIVATDREKKITFINQRASSLACSEEECSILTGQNYLEIFKFVVKKGRRMIPIDPVSEVSDHFLIYCFPKDSFLITSRKQIPVIGSFAPIIKNNKIIGVVGIFQDITERYSLEKEKDEFLSIAAHQLRTPLSGIRWMLEMLIEGDAGELPEEAKEILHDIFNNNQRLAFLVDDLLDVSRINMGKLTESVDSINIIDTISQAITALDGLAKQREINIIFEKGNAGKSRVKMGMRRLFQLLENVISNAIKYSPKGSSVKIAANFDGNKICVTVSDSGIGIPEKYKDKIFGKFFRAPNAVLNETEGSGLGLNVVKSYVEEAGGRVWFESQEEKGTTFFIELPAVPWM